MFQMRKTAALVITSVFAASTLLSASAQSTAKSLSGNFTLVNLVSGANNGQIQYVLQDGSEWRLSETFSLNGIGDLVIKRRSGDANPAPTAVLSSSAQTDQSALSCRFRLAAKPRPPALMSV